MLRGKLIIVLIVLVALVLGSYAWWHNMQRGRRSLGLWGSEAAVLIRYAPHVELLQLKNARQADGSAETLAIGNARVAIARRTQISEVRGVVHARHALIEDASYVWDQSPGDCTPQWEFALRFARDDQQATVAFDVNCQQVRLVEREQAARLRKEQMRAFHRKSKEWSKAAIADLRPPAE